MLSKKAKALTDKLIATYLSQGIRPSDIADTIFEDNYLDLNISKKNKQLIMTFTFEEFDDVDQKILNSMRYTYDEQQLLVRVEQKIGRGRYTVQWDRHEDLTNILKELLSLVPAGASRERVISTLPQYLRAYTISQLVA
ncbi:hypothetical protein [Vibrio cholerae]|uniref:hypothetical protein n=1 Tax=Vibrio cholerae TaxID=666 RepID=UPI0011DC4DFE|nr:hypothetical protein [Vibrio cholerae]EGQ7641709.1 hypothetical protein [Vibrio cholerae]EHE6948927.1 hypothetical protein [Vibrio cholerae]EJN3163469.1 hypothetical protein [Vibrio cholerae]EKF9441076.1 hypothetical protein [Vibrio cholerae]ELT5929226.1 hypothetical protein [Vibrio cholerae]